MPQTPLKTLDVVALLVDKPEEQLVTGQVGTVVELIAPDVYEVEFDPEGTHNCDHGIEAKILVASARAGNGSLTHGTSHMSASLQLKGGRRVCAALLFMALARPR